LTLNKICNYRNKSGKREGFLSWIPAVMSIRKHTRSCVDKATQM